MSNGIDPLTGLTGSAGKSDPSPEYDPTYDILAGAISNRPGRYVGEFLPGGRGSKYDINLTESDLPNIERQRALHQSGVSKAFNGVVGGIASGVLTAAEDIAYIADISNNVNRLMGVENVEINEFAKVMRGAKEELAKVMPIHRLTQDVFDWHDPGFYWSSVKGILDSAVGFAIPGAAAVKGVGALQKISRLSKYLKFLRATPTVQKMVNTVGSAYLTNLGESKIMGVELFENTVANLEADLLDQNHTDIIKEYEGSNFTPQKIYQMAVEKTNYDLREDGKAKLFEDIAGTEANKFMLRNKAFMLSDMVGLHGLYKGKGATRALLQKRGMKTTIKNLGTLSADNLALQSLKEGAEEIGQNILQMEGEYKAAKKAGFESESPDEFWARTMEFATSDQALLEGMMGLFGGGPQRIGTKFFSGEYTGKAKAEHQARFDDQQSQIKANTEYLNTKISHLSTARLLMDQANERGDDRADKYVRDNEFVKIAAENFIRGTTESLQRSLEDVATGEISEEQAAENGWDPGYQDRAKEQIGELGQMEKSWLRHNGMYGQTEIFMNRENRKLIEKNLENINEEISNLEVQEQVEREAGVPDPQTETDLEVGRKLRNEMVSKITELDETYKKLVSDEHQKKEKAKEKVEKKKAKDLIEENKSKLKATKDKEKAEARQNKTERKAREAQNQREPEKEEEKVEDIEHEEVDDEGNVIKKPAPKKKPIPKKEGVSPFAGREATVETPKKTYDDPNQQAIRDRMRQTGRDLLDSFASEEAAPIGEEITPGAKRFMFLEQMLKDAKELTGEDPTFSDVIDVLVEDHGFDAVSEIFTRLEGVYLSEMNPNYQPTLDLGRFRKLTPDERIELEGAKKVTDTVVVNQYTHKKDEEIEEQADGIRRDVQNVNQPPQSPQDETDIDYRKINKGAGAFAYLSRAYDFVYNDGAYDREEITDMLNKDLLDFDLLDPTKYTEGTSITLRPLHNENDIKAYDNGEIDSETTWGAKKNTWKEQLDKGAITQAEYDQLYLEQVPIGIFNEDGKRVAYLHETPWINDNNVSGDVEADRNRSREIRKHIIDNKEYATKVLSKSTGYLFLSSEGYVPLSRAMPSEDLELFIGADEERRRSRTEGDVVEGEFVGKDHELMEGVLYAALPLQGDKKIAVPLRSDTLDEYPEVISSIMTAIHAFYGYRQLTQNERDFVAMVKDKMGLDLNTNDGFNTYIKTFIRDFETGKGVNLAKIVEGSKYGDYETDAFVALTGMSEGDVTFQIARGRGTAYVYISRASIERMGKDDDGAEVPELRESQYEKFTNDIEEELGNVFLHANLGELYAGREVVTVDANENTDTEDYKSFIRDRFKTKFMSNNIGTEENPNHVYTIQPVIEIDFQDIGAPVVTEKPEVEPAPPAPVEVEEKPEVEPEVEPEEKPKYKKTKFNIDPSDSIFATDLEEFTSDATAPFNPDQVAETKKKAEVVVDVIERDGKEYVVRKSGVFIGNMDSSKQKQVVDYLRGKAVVTIVSTKEEVNIDELIKDEMVDFQETLDDTLENLEQAKNFGDTEAITKFSATIRGMQQILNNKEGIIALVKTQLDKIASVEEPMIDEENEEDTPEQKAEKQSQDWGGEGAYTLNHLRGLAPELKYFFSGIGKYRIDENTGEPTADMTYFGAHKPMNHEEIYNIVQRLTTNKIASFNALITHLDGYTTGDKLKTYPFMRELVKKLRDAPEQVKMQFVVGMTNNNHNMRHVQSGSNSKNTRSTQLVIFNSNANEVERTILTDWNKNLIANTAVDGGDGDNIIPAKTRKYINDTFQRWRKSGKAPPREEVREWLEVAGIFLTDKGFNDLMEGNVQFGRKKKTASKMHKKGGVLYVIDKWFQNQQDDPIITGQEVTEDNAIKSLAKHDAQYIFNAFSNSFRTGKRQVHSYGQNKYVVVRTREITSFENGKNDLLRHMMKLPFNGKSLWGEGLQRKEKQEGDNVYRENLERWVFSLEPLKRKGASDQDNREMSKLSEDAIEGAKIGMMEGGETDRSGNNRRIISVSYYTTSDKSSAVGIRVPAQDMFVDENGNLTQDSIRLIREYVVQPEINRIQAYQKQDPENRPDLEGYEEGSQQFLLLPLLNEIQGIFDEKGKLNENINSPRMRNQIDQTIRDYMTDMVDQKTKFWKESGIITDNSTPFLDRGYLNGNFNGDNTPMKQQIGDVDRKQVIDEGIKAKVAATDMVFQYLISNAEIAKLYTGDPAMYFKRAKVNKNKSKSDPEYDFVADAEETYINIGKRLAADIAPGYELAESHDNQYFQIFGADAKGSSVIKRELTRILDGPKHYEKVKDMDDEQLKKYLDENDLVSARYYDFDSTDAQEYTTWREHLYVMRHLGEISRDEHDKAYKVFRQQELGKDVKLDKTIMGKVMQPMKPVYVGNIPNVKQGIDRRIYIKSSSFPLIPELTAGTQLDNLRQAMTDVKGNKDIAARFAFSTAVKVGNFTEETRVNIFDKDGNIKPADQIDFSKSMIKLNRKDFRIQQKVPYDPTVLEINRVTQATKNLLVNMLGIGGFEIGGKIFSGEALQKFYSDQFEQIHKLERDDLERQLRTKDGGININELKKILRKEARDRNFPISDQEMLELSEELSFISMSPSSDKYEALLNSIVYSRVVKFTMPGKSFVLGSEEGLKARIITEEEAEKEGLTSGIVYTNNWNGKYLLPAREDKVTGKRRGAQVFIPWKMRNQEDELIDISKYTTTDEDGNIILDTDKVPDDVLELFGMRIPNQGPNSQSYIEIAGFLPEASGDLMIATKDHVAQMGSDFDVDKLYTYMYNLYEDDKVGKIGIHRFRKFKEDADPKIVKKARIRDLQNRIIDIHLAVHKNTSEEVQAQIANPLGEWRLQEFANKIEGYHVNRKKTENIKTTSDVTFRGGYSRTGRDSAAGDAKDKAMRQIADGFIGETDKAADIPSNLRKGKGKTSTMTSFYSIGTRGGYHEDFISSDEGGVTIGSGKMVTATDFARTVMLARDETLSEQALDANTKELILDAHNAEATFVVGDEPNLDSQFVDYLKEIGADFTVFHTGNKPRIRVEKAAPPRNYFTGLSDDYQRSKFKSGSVGKEAVSAFSLDSMFVAVAQGKDLGFERQTEEETEPITVTFGKVHSEGELSDERTLKGTASNGTTYRSDVVNGYQSAALDHEKLQIHNRINVNPHTFNVVKVMNALGFEEETVMFINQDIILDYIAEIERLSSPLAPFVGDRKRVAKKTIMKKYGIAPKAKAKNSLANEGATVETMEGYIRDGEKASNYTEAQHAFLNKFIQLDKLGGKLLSVQSAINVDSKSFGKSVMEAQIKEDQVFNLENSLIRNVNSLVGDIRPNVQPDEVADLKEQGFVVSQLDEYHSIRAIKSTTINGHAIAYGLLTNNDMWSRVFPYKTPSVDKMLDRIESITANGGGDSSSSSKADRRLKAWKQLKSYIYATNTLGLFDEGTTITEERERLLYDRFDKDHKRVSESLARMVEKLKQSGIGKTHPFLSKLEVKIEVAGKPSLITYRASRAEDLDETEMYAEFLNLITTENAEGKSPVLQVTNERGEDVDLMFNRKAYRMRDLGQDLIAYAYITGGIQEALQFVKYIPAAYLTTIPFAERLSNMDLMTKDFGIEGDEANMFENIYSNPAFIEQYVQHFPDQIPQVTSKEALNKDVKNATFSSFRLSDITVQKIGVSDGEGDLIPPPYVSVSLGRSVTGMKLFKYYPDIDLYIQIDTLGSTAASEYNRDTAEGESQQSLIKHNRSPVPPENRPGAIGSESRIPNSKKPSQSGQSSTAIDTLKKIADGSHASETFDDGINASRKILNHIVNNVNDPYLSLLGTELLKTMDQLPTNMKFTVGSTTEGAFGRYSYADDELTLFKKGKGEKRDERNVARTFEHELIHGLTGYKVLYYEAEEAVKAAEKKGEKDKESQARLDYFDNLKGFKFTQKDRTAVKSLKTLFNQALQELVHDKGKTGAYEDFLKRHAAKQGQSPEEINDFYGFKDLREFITAALTNPEFQKMLNNVEAPSGKTFWEALKERIIKLLEALGINAREGSVLYQAIYDVLDLVESDSDKNITNVGHYRGFRVEEGTLRKRKDHFPSARYDRKTNIVTVDNIAIQEGFNNKVWEGEVDFEFVTFDQWKDFVIETEIQRALNPKLSADKINQLALKEMNRRKVDQRVYFYPDEHGTQLYYRVTFENNDLRKMEASVDNPNNWTEMDIDTGRDVYQNIVFDNAEEVTTQTLSDNQFVVDNMVITPTKEQVTALDKMRDFLKSDDKFFTLSGYGGTGKTTLIRKIIDEHEGSVIVSAPSHNIKNHIINVTRTKGRTLHALLGLRKRDNKFIVDPDKVMIGNYDLIIIDNASSLSDENFATIEKYAKGKVIFLGDEAQTTFLEKESKVFSTLRKTKNFFQLKESRRVKGGNPIIDVYTTIRNNLDKDGAGIVREDMISPEGEGVAFIKDAPEFLDKLKQAFTSQEFAASPNYARVIGQRKERLDKTNDTIRNLIYDDPDVVEEGDLLVGFATINRGGEPFIDNGAEYQVINKVDTVKRGVKGWDVTLHTKNEGKNITKMVFIVDHNDIESLKEYRDLHTFYWDAAKNDNKWDKLSNFRSNYIIMKDSGTFSRSMGYGYAIDSRKADGSTYSNVFILEDDINTEPKVVKRNQMLYTAFTRAASMVNVFIGKKRKASTGNNYVTEAKVPETKPVPKQEAGGGSPFTKLKSVNPDSVGMTENSEDLGSGDHVGYSNLDVSEGYEYVEPTGSIESDRAITPPEDFVSDQEVENFMTQCK